MRIVFLGTPEFAVPSLEALARAHDVALVVAQPDKRAGRGLKLQSPAIARKANELGLPLLQPAKIRDVLTEIKAADPDIGVVVAYGKILPSTLLQIPKNGFVNVHASVLPRYRGAAPIQRAIEHGETETGVTIMRVDEELDHGPILSIEKTPIDPHDRAPALSRRLSQLGADLLLRTLAVNAHETVQDHAKTTLAPKIEKSEGEIRWSDPASAIYNKFRAFDPWPGVYTDDLKLVEIEPATGSAAAGTILSIDDSGVTVATREGAVKLIAVQRPGKSRQRAVDFARGARWRVGEPVS
ncbi:MAG TPA: methionyl-tRNA formyltransferase [Thermoanaerobaculia bacterium]|nr:methionyl-tRNA formyltransferase [Thermoanaerobaculia bacterium]